MYKRVLLLYDIIMYCKVLIQMFVILQQDDMMLRVFNYNTLEKVKFCHMILHLDTCRNVCSYKICIIVLRNIAKKKEQIDKTN